MYTVGSIVRIQNLIFKTNDKQNRCFIDHAYKSGRPCLIISENEDFIYFLPLKSVDSKEYDHQIKIGRNKCIKESSVNVENIYKKPVCYLKELNHFNDKEFFKVLSQFYKYQTETKSDEYFSEIGNDIQFQIASLLNKLNSSRIKKH